MRKCIYMLFPEGKPKALTLSYDDGVVQDVRFMKILDRYGIKCTFNLNSGRFPTETPAEMPARGNLCVQAVKELYANSGHEVAVHSLTHPFLEKIPPHLACLEVLEDRRNLEAMFGGIVRGMAYPQGTYSDSVVECLRLCDVAYARTTVTTESFAVPTDWLRLHPTCHHNNPHLFELVDRFLNSAPFLEPWLFYLWGHSYEFDDYDNWDRIEKFCESIGGRDDIWYATNIEIFDYVQAYQRLVYSSSADLVYNPSVIPVWINYNEQPLMIGAGEYKVLN